jgi:hypothetical protein
VRRGKLGLALALALLTGAALRFANVADMEYKEDEEINFTASQAIVRDWPKLPPTGMPSGVYIPNPGLSVWMFGAAAAVSGAHTPPELERAVQVVSLLGICLILPFAFGFVGPGRERELWLWAFALALVNPFLIVYHRKLWPQPFLPLFSMLMLMGYWRRERSIGAFAWGFVGALLGQVHMAGFFVAGGLALWTGLFDRARPRWRAWFAGSALGTLPLIPWLSLALHAPRGGAIGAASEPLQLKYWVFWVTDAFGLHLGNPLGLSRGGVLAQIADFCRYPLWAGRPTYIVGAAHVALVALALGLACGAARALHLRSQSLWWKALRARPRLVWDLTQRVGRLPGLASRISDTRFVGQALWFATGLLLTATFVNIRRYYLCATFPFEGIAFVAAAFYAFEAARARRWLLALWVAQAVVSAGFVYYVHVNQGAPAGDYGDAYHVVLRKRAGH